MCYKKHDCSRLIMNSISGNYIRKIDPNDILLPRGYKIEAYAQGLNTPACILFAEEGEIYIADTGYTNGRPVILKQVNGNFEFFADNFNVPLIGITYLEGDIYVAHKGTISVLKKDGSRQDILNGLPSSGDYSNCKVGFGPDGKMYFGQGTATNSGVVGLDNNWLYSYPFFHDYPGSNILLYGQNFETKNILTPYGNETTSTGAFSPFGESNNPYSVKRNVIRASGGVLKANLDGTQLELVAWGLRATSYVKFDNAGRLFVASDGFDIRGSRPIANAPDEFQLITPGTWYGWPDYCGGEPVTLPKFRPEGARQPEFLIANHPGVPPRPFAVFQNNSTIIGFDFNYNNNFGTYGDAYIAEFGFVAPFTYESSEPPYTGVGHRVSKIDMKTGAVSTFAINKSGYPAYLTDGGGLNRPADIAFGPDGALYIVDMGANLVNDPNTFIPNTGVIWKVTRVNANFENMNNNKSS